MRKSNILTHNHNYLMETITLEVHHNTPTSPRNTLTTIFKSILIIFVFIFFAYFLFEHIMHGHIRKKRNTQLCKPKHHNFATLKHTNVIHDWQILVVRWLFITFFQDFLVLPVKKSDMSIKYKRLLNRTHHQHESQNSLAQLCIKMLI